MKKTLCCCLCRAGIAFAATQHAWADIATMRLNWTIPDSSDITLFKFYYSQNSDMSKKIWH